MRPAARWVRGVLLLLAAATLATVAGAAAAIGPARWLHGDRALGAAGIALLALAVGSLVLLWHRATRRRPWFVRWPAAVAGFVVAAVLALPAAIGVYAAWPARAVVGAAAPEGAREVTLPAADGTTLAGWYLPGDNGAGLVLAHGASGTRASVLDQAAVLRRHGYSLLLLDARGHGRSGGHPMELGWWGEADLRAAVDWLAAQPEVMPGRIGLVGLSMGGEEAVGAAGADPRVAAVVAEGVTGRTAADKDRWLPRNPLGAIQRGMDAWRDVLVGALSDAPKPPPLVSAAASSRAPVLLITGAQVPDEAAAAAVLQAAARDRVEVWTVPGAGHTGGLATDPEGWERRVDVFLTRALAPPA